VASGISIILVAVIWLGMSRFFEKGQHYSSYFDESVQGLDIDSPVKYRGVSIGRVESISVAPDSKLIQVVLKIESGQTLEKNIVAQLKSVGITGSMFVELDRKKPGEMDRSPRLTFPSEFPIVASKPSEISEILRGIDDALDQIRSLDLRVISDMAKLTLKNINRMIADANVKGISTGIESSLADIGYILKRERWDRIMADIQEAGKSLNIMMGKATSSLARVENAVTRVEGIVTEKEIAIKAAIEDFSRAMKKANHLLESGVSLVSGTDNTLFYLRRNLLVIGQNLEKASGNLDRLAELLADQPSQLIFGAPPSPREVEPDTSEK